ncbi:MAG: N-6 DNA methylase [Bacteroidales bacterium]|nr:N-6 DNA methylase [Bacteroidales bacterium]
MLKKYLKDLQDTFNQGDAREESYYKHLENLFLNFAENKKIKDVHITILPKKTEAGNPDFRVWDGKNHITGYIEAKDPSVKNLDRIEDTEQLKRYRTTFPNVILTNFYEFRLYRDGELIEKTFIGRPVIAHKLKTTPPVENQTEFFQLLDKFFSFSLPHVKTAKALALELAKRTRFLRDEVISIELEDEEKNGKKVILGFYEAFKKYLIGTLTKKQFADLYSQTITYGLFAARTRAENGFNRELAFKYIPNTIGILRDVFKFISFEEPPKALQVIVDDISEVLHVTDVKIILQEYFKEGKGKDPIIHFYETFLAAYDPAIRERRGVYYTPEPVVSYIVSSINQILKTHFELADGLASPEVTLLDPAGGTLTFPAEALKLAVKEYTEKYGEGGKNNLIKNQILPNFYAFELMMAPYAIGHLKMSFLFEELGYRLNDNERFNLYLTNTLEMDDLEQIHIPGLSSLSEESHLAGKVKKDKAVLVILGNPPYSGHSANKNDWTEKLLKQDIVDGVPIQSYYKIDGKSLGEKNPKWLQDDYVKFLRFAQWKIQKAGFGIVGMITNHSYLDNPTFRGMRQSLMKTYNEIYILDLHGNSLKKETTPEGGKDENVFDIRQGVAIVLFVKLKDKKNCKIYHTDLFGLREKKYNWLEKNEFTVKNYKEITPETPYYFLIKRDTEKIKDYLKWTKINEIFPVNSVGIVTARDKLTIKLSEHEAWNTVLNFSKLDPEIAREAYNLGEDARDWKVTFAQRDLKDSGLDRDKIEKILYRPFDERFTYYTGRSRGFHCMPRKEVMQHIIKGNFGIITSRIIKGAKYQHTFVTENITDASLLAANTASSSYLFPLYIYPEKNPQKKKSGKILMLFEPEEKYITKRPNIQGTLFEKLNGKYNKHLTPEEILYYIYGILYSNVYREKYAEFLKIDFPRIPFTADYDLFEKIAEYGKKLSDLHLLKSEIINNPIAKYQGIGENDRIEKIQYTENEQRIYINNEKYFEGIIPEVWNYYIGGYQVLRKYLKDRKTRIMDDPRHYCKIVTAISKTIEIQKQIDEIYEEVEDELIEL